MQEKNSIKDWFLCSTWINGVQRLDVRKETQHQLTLESGRKIMKRNSQSHFTGNTKEEAKTHYIEKLNKDLETAKRTVKCLQDKIDDIKTW
jgi:predicted RNase H-like nuclease (RuvC/YqgF family)